MAEAARAFPNDDTIQVLFAESLMDLSPWDYWEAAGSKPKNRTAEMVDALERVLERNPTHPGAAHYYIHAMEASTHPDKALPAARVLARQIPGAGHIVHMPSHIYYRIGMYKDALQSNLDAIAADEKYFRRSDSDPVYKGAYYPHNIHFLMVSALMGGDGKTALDAAAKLDKSLGPELVKEFAGLQPVKAAPYFSHVQFSSPDVLVALPDPGPDFVLVKAMWHYARAVGFARKGALADSQKEIDAHRRASSAAPTSSRSPTGPCRRAKSSTPRARSPADAWPMPAATCRPRSRPTRRRWRCRTRCPTPSRRTGTTRCASRSARRCCAPASSTRPSRPSAPRWRARPSNGWALRGLIEVYRKRGDAAALAAAQKRFEYDLAGQAGRAGAVVAVARHAWPATTTPTRRVGVVRLPDAAPRSALSYISTRLSKPP